MRSKVNDLQKIRVGAVSYLNTKPLLYGIRRHEVMKEIELIEDYPANIAKMLINDTIDVGLIPVAVIPRLKEHHIITDYCIGADGAVASVCLFSEVPMEEIKTVYLDYQSRTSVALAKLLLRDYWKKDVTFVDAKGEEYRDKISGSVAGVVIGDRALKQRLLSPFIYDLAEAWKAWTGLPFVFAAWVSNKELLTSFLTSFSDANALGIQNIEAVLLENHFEHYDLDTYYRKCISYELTDSKRIGLKRFLNLLQAN
ncbi:MAG: hypothetical protein JWP69_914 [Flaviaesturariibacter sp.]|nr:hypothetical protein [Flaviaesturariibacter sp.]